MSGQPYTPRNRGDYDAPHQSSVTAAEDVRTVVINRISWGAVLAGVVVALVVQLLLNMLGVGIGAATLDPVTGDNPSASSLSLGAAIWFAVAGILAALAGGYAAGRLAGAPRESTAAWHGLTTWAVSTLVILYLLTTAVGGIIGGAYRGMASVIGGTGSVTGTAAQTAAQAAVPNLSRMSDPFSSIEQSVRSATGGNDPGALTDAAVAAVRAAVTGDAQKADEAVTGQLRASPKRRMCRSTKHEPRSSNTRVNSGRPRTKPGSRLRKPPKWLRKPCREERSWVPSA
jgi:hypothetical protein